MKYTNIVFCILLFLLVAPVVFAVKPTTSVASGILDIQYPLFDYFPRGSNVTLNFHVYNVSNGKLLTNASADCELHIYDRRGAEIVDVTKLNYTSDDFYYIINSTVLSKTVYTYIISCNTTAGGGAVSTTFSVLTDEQINTQILGTDSTGGISITIFFVMLTLMFFVVSMSEFKLMSNKYWNLIIKRCMFIVGVFLTLFDSGIVLTIALANGYSLGGQISSIISIIGYAGYALIFGIFLKTMFDAISMKRVDDEGRRMGEDAED